MNATLYINYTSIKSITTEKEFNLLVSQFVHL